MSGKLLLSAVIVFALLPGTAFVGAQEKKPAGLDQKVSLDFTETPLKDALDFLVKEAGLNYIISDDALEDAPKITANMKDVAVRDVVEGIALSCGLDIEITDSGLVVLFWPREEEEEEEEN